MKNIRSASIAALILCLLLTASQIFAGTTYYVDGSAGADNNPGTASLPWKTIQKAANTMVAGDTAIVKAGTYNERVRPSRSGSAGNVITYKAASTNAVTVNGGFTVRVNYIKIDGFRVTGATTCSFSDTDFNILISGGYCEVANCYVYKAKNGGIRAGQASYNCFIHDNICCRNGGRE